MSIVTQLSLFIDVVQQNSFSKAAALHEMDNSSLSKQIKKLETSLGVQLLNRSTRSFSLTPVGEEILKKATQLKVTLDEIQTIANTHQFEPKGKLRITAPIFWGQEYLQPVISKFMAQYPQVEISLILADKQTDIITDHFDLAFRVGKLNESNLIAKKIAPTQFAIIASELFIQKHGTPTTPDELIKLPAVIFTNGDTVLDKLRISKTPHKSDWENYKMQGNYKVSDVRTLMAAVKDGIGYSLIDLFNLEQPITESRLFPLLTEHRLSTMDTGIYVVYPHRQQPILVREFITSVQHHIGAPPFWSNHIPNYSQLYR